MTRQPILKRSLSDPAVVQAIREPLTRSVLEVVRRFNRAATPSEIGRVSGLEFIAIRRGLDLLEEAGLVGRRPAEGDRREPAFFAVCDALIVTFNRGDPAQIALLEELDQRVMDHARARLNDARVARPTGTSGFRFRGYIPMKLDPEELAEMKSILHGLHRFFEKVSSKQRIVDDSESQECNYHALIDISPAAPGLLPMAPISFVSEHEALSLERMIETRRIDNLSPREKDVAVALARGRSRPEIAAELRLSINTVASIGKRVYAKLGVSRRAELAARLHS